MESLVNQLLRLDEKDEKERDRHMKKALTHPIASHFVEKVIQVLVLDFLLPI